MRTCLLLFALALGACEMDGFGRPLVFGEIDCGAFTCGDGELCVLRGGGADAGTGAGPVPQCVQVSGCRLFDCSSVTSCTVPHACGAQACGSVFDDGEWTGGTCAPWSVAGRNVTCGCP